MFDRDADYELDELIRRSTQVGMPNEVETRLRARLAALRTKVEQRPPSRLRTFVDTLLHPPSFRVPAMAATVIAAIMVALVILPGGSKASRMYSAAAAQFRTAQSLEYKIVLAPFTEVEISYLAPASRRSSCSWGIEARSDNSGRQLVLFHGTRQYVLEEGKQGNNLAGQEDLVEQLRALPKTADSALGERQRGSKRLIGYRVNPAPFGATFGGLKALDLWVNAATGDPDHVDIVVQEEGKPVYRMQIADIRVNAAIDHAKFDMTPPAGYTKFASPGAADKSIQAIGLKPEIKQAGAMTAVVVPMRGSYLQAEGAVAKVEERLKEMGVAPAGPAFGRFSSEQDWDAGYPVAPGTRVEAPFRVVELPATAVASATVSGAWGQNSDARWTAFMKWAIEQGYQPAGPAMEFWTGENAKPATQSTEMRMPVTKAK